MGRKSYDLSFTHGKTLGKRLSGQFYSSILQLLTREVAFCSSQLPYALAASPGLCPDLQQPLHFLGWDTEQTRWKKGGKSAKNPKRGQTCEWNLAAPAVDTWGVMLHVNAVQSPPVKWLKLQKMMLHMWHYEECSVLMHIMNMPWW